MKIEILDETGSTNEYVRRYLPYGQDVLVVARKQTAGKGTKGRSFLSREGGVYLSRLKFYSHFPAHDAFLAVAQAAVAVCRTAEFYGLRPEIKWPNDVYLSGKKLAGILAENVIEGECLKACIVGIGLNVNNDLGDLSEIAIGLSSQLEEPLAVEEVRARLIENLEKHSDFSDYLERVRFLGKEVVVTENGESYSALARRIESDGALTIEYCGKERKLSAAEISLAI